MSTRNAVYRRSVELLSHEEGMDLDRASRLVSSAMREPSVERLPSDLDVMKPAVVDMPIRKGRFGKGIKV